jgi:hypothetical protein
MILVVIIEEQTLLVHALVRLIEEADCKNTYPTLQQMILLKKTIA